MKPRSQFTALPLPLTRDTATHIKNRGAAYIDQGQLKMALADLDAANRIMSRITHYLNDDDATATPDLFAGLT